MSNGKRTYQVEVSNGASYTIEAIGFDDAASKMRKSPDLYPIPKHCVIGMECGTLKPRFFLKREDGDTLWPVAASVAATFASIGH